MPTQLGNGEGRDPLGRNEYVHHGDRRGKGPGTGERFVEVTLGRCYAQAGADRNLHKPADRGSDHRRREGLGLAHEPSSSDNGGATLSRTWSKQPWRKR